MTILLNSSKEIINKNTVDKKVDSIKLVDSVPSDINEFVYKYINGELVRDRAIDFNYKSQETINAEQLATNSEQDEINIDLDYRITMLELGL